jgi:hypothetical protein
VWASVLRVARAQDHILIIVAKLIAIRGILWMPVAHTVEQRLGDRVSIDQSATARSHLLDDIRVVSAALSDELDLKHRPYSRRSSEYTETETAVAP